MTLDHLANDLRFSIRQFVKRPGLTAAALFALTCGLGGVTTVFTLVDAVILRTLPVPAPHQLVLMRDPSFSYPVYEEVAARASMLSHVFAWESRQMQAQWTSEPESTPVLLATGTMSETLGIRPAAGRLLTPADSGRSANDAQAVAVLSYSAWQRRFDGNPAAIGSTVRIEGTPFTIVGVTPPGFYGVSVGVPVDLTIPVTILPRLREDERTALTAVGQSWLHIMGRLRPGVTVEAADAAFQPIWRDILRVTADGITPSFRSRYLTFTSGLESGASGFSPVRRQFRDALWLLFALVSLLLVVACATVANLLLAAAAGRQHELALRFALGARRMRIAQQLFIEGLLLSIAGSVLGLLLSAWATDLLLRLLSTSYESVVVGAGPDARVFAFVALLACASTIAFTVAPILRAARFDRKELLEAGTRATADQRGYAARALVVAQVALSLTLLAGSALFVRNLQKILSTDVGFDRSNLLVVGVDALSPLSAAQRRAAGDVNMVNYYAGLLEELRSTPGVQRASLSHKPPISNEQGSWWSMFGPDGGVVPPPTPAGRTYLNAVSPGYFDTMAMPIIAGRDFTWSDRDGAPRVVIINQTLARQHFGSESPVGRYLLMDSQATRVEVVGLVRDTSYQFVREDRRRIAYLPYMQQPGLLRARPLVAEVRTAAPGAAIVNSVRATVRRIDPTAPLVIQSVAERIDESLVRERLLTLIAGFLGVTSLLLACGALGGLLSHVVTMRTREIGLRLALGAERRGVMQLVMRQALALAAAGAIAGTGFALVGGRYLSAFLTTVDPADPWAIAGAVALLLTTSAIAGYIPARRAAGVDPMVALRAN